VITQRGREIQMVRIIHMTPTGNIDEEDHEEGE
jgi:hypothetical protein